MNNPINNLRERVQSGYGLNNDQATYVFSRMDAAIPPIFHPAPSALLIPTETHTSIYDPLTGIQYTLTVDAGPDLSKFLSPVTFRILNAAATSDSEYPNIFIKGEEALEWWRQIVAHYRSQNRIAKFQYNQAVVAEKKAGDILRQWTMDKEDRESVPSPDPSAIPF